MSGRANATTGTRGLLVQYGCGLSAPEEWLNFDSSITLRVQKIPLLGGILTHGRVQFPKSVRYGDVVAGLPVADGQCRAVYCSHVLEHLSLNDFRQALRETHRILREGGIFRGVLPDLEAHIAAYAADANADAAIKFIDQTLLGVRDRLKGVAGVADALLSGSHHLWMWDFKAISGELEAAGFSNVRRASIGDSAETAFSIVEEKSRWDGCLGFECIR